MGKCRSGKVEEVVEDTNDALVQVAEIEELLSEQSDLREVEFSKRIDEHFDSLGIEDEIIRQENEYIKVEYASEFSLDKIANVVGEALSSASAIALGGSTGGLLSGDATESYTDVVIAIAEAAKTSSRSGSSGSFSVTRIAPGIIAFIYTTSTSIDDSQTFGNESITATTINYKLFESAQDHALTQGIRLRKMRIDTQMKSYNDFRSFQAVILNQLSKEKITFEEYEKRDEKYSKKMEELYQRVQDAIDDVTEPTIKANKFVFNWGEVEETNSIKKVRSNKNIQLVRKSIEKLSEHGDKYKKVIENQKKRLSENYY